MFPNRIELAQKNTPIEKLERLSKSVGKNIFIKRDDLTGIELSGNKVRKLEYALGEAMHLDADVIITCGAIQSNHARATAVAARKLGLKIHLVLRGEEPEHISGNLLLNRILGAEITFLSAEAFSNHQAVMDSIKADYAKVGLRAYIIPIGASNGIGNFGYYNAYQEILHQEVEMNTTFDAIVCTVGSGGTYSGLFLGNHFNAYRKKLVGYSVGGSSASFIEQSKKILSDSNEILSHLSEGGLETFADAHTIIDDYQGSGYAQTSIEDIAFIKYVAEQEGLILDPVYTGKAFKGMMTQIKEGLYDDCTNILFIHTGGIFGLEAFESWFK